MKISRRGALGIKVPNRIKSHVMICDELIRILIRGEGQGVEFKSDFPAQAHAIAKEMAGFANSGGGVLLMGIRDDGAPIGIAEPERVVERLINVARSCTPSVNAEVDRFQLSQNIFLVYAKVQPARSLTLYQGKTYKRTGSITHEATGDEVMRIVENLQAASSKSPASHKLRNARKSKALAGKPRGNSQPTTTATISEKLRLPAMLALGRVKVGDKLTIKGQDGSEAEIIDGQTVRFRGKEITFNAWGERVTGHKAVNIYVHALTSDGRLLDELR